MRRVNLIPMAGEGQRFIDAGYKTPKPLVEVNGTAMFIGAAESLPHADHWIFLCRKEHIDEYGIDEKLKERFPDADIISVNYLTEGQASTCLLAKDLIRENDQLTIGTCDNSMEHDRNAVLDQILTTDAVIWTFRNNPAVLQNPRMYGWVKVNDKDKAVQISCKQPISAAPLNDHAIIGTFSFQRASTFFRGVESMIQKNRRINDEFYIDIALDECIRLGYEVFPSEVNSYTCWGTPQDVEKYNDSFI
jgi:NDP-sugar pyrophosphorylase family protein